MMESIDEDWFEGESFAVPTMSTVSHLQLLKEKEDENVKFWLKSQHDKIVELEHAHLSGRHKSFELLRTQEECLRFHDLAAIGEETDGKFLADSLVNSSKESNFQRTVSTTRNDPEVHASFVVFEYVSAFTMEMHRGKQSSSSSFHFPWSRCDDDVCASCLQLLGQSKVDECRSYLIGYFEAMGRISIEDATSQGKIFIDRIGWLVGHHPFGAHFAKFLVAFKIMLNKVLIQTMQWNPVSSMIKEFLSVTCRAWIESWSEVSRIGHGAVMGELIVEALQHVTFLALPHLPRILGLCAPTEGQIKEASKEANRETGSPHISTCASAAEVTSDEVPVATAVEVTVESVAVTGHQSLASVEMQLEDQLQQKMRLCNEVREDVAVEVGVRAHTLADTHAHHQAVRDVPPKPSNALQHLEEICFVPARFRVTMLTSLPSSSPSRCHELTETPFVAVGRDIAVLRCARTPVEVGSILVAIMDSVMGVANRMLDVGKGSSGPTNAIGADELIPLLTFSFRLYFALHCAPDGGGKSTSKSKSSGGAQTREQLLEELQTHGSIAAAPYETEKEILALLRFADFFYPEHLLCRREGYALAACTSALLTLPP